MKRERPDDIENELVNVRKAYKDTLKSDYQFLFTLKSPHSKYISYNQVATLGSTL